MDSIERCIDEIALHELEIQHRLKRLNDKKRQIQECKVQEVKVANASSRDTYSSGFIIDNRNAHRSENDYSKTKNDQSSEKRSSTLRNERMEMDVTTWLESPILSLIHTHTKSFRQGVSFTNLKSGVA
nr:hypothetical protein [Tanacetum cinerariifolium]